MPNAKCLTALFLLASLAACGGSDAPAPAPPPSPPPAPAPIAVQAGDFELVAGTLSQAAPAGLAPCQNGPALGAALPRQGLVSSDDQGRIYRLAQDCEPGATTLHLFTIDTTTGQTKVQPVPYDPEPDYAQPGLTKLLDPSALAVGSDGTVFIGDGRRYDLPNVGVGSRGLPGYGLGIWKFKDGVLSPLVGFSHPVSVGARDGVAGEAALGSIDRLCSGPDGTLFVEDQESYRQVAANGTVTTLHERLQPQARMSPLVCATGQRAFAVLPGVGGRQGYQDLSSGQGFGPIDRLAAQFYTVNLGFGDGMALTVASDAAGEMTWAMVSLRQQAVSSPWIKAPTLRAAERAFQLSSRPYTMPFASVIAGPAPWAYVFSGNAVLRYRLPETVQ